MEQAPEDEEHMWQILEKAIGEAAEKFVETRTREGENLKQDLLGKLDYMVTLVDQIEERSPKIVEEYRAKLEDKVKELLEGSSVDEGRIAAEVVIFADKICVDEETVRLRSHIRQYRDILEKNEPVGRKLDFLTQELNRETNTIGSKAQELAITRMVVDMKAEIEKIREQIQNIE